MLLSNKKLLSQIKRKYQETFVRPGTMYRSKCLPKKTKEETIMKVTEIVMLKWMDGLIRLDRIKNEHIKESSYIMNLAKKMKDNILGWFWNVWEKN